jgi:hypothetical protein
MTREEITGFSGLIRLVPSRSADESGIMGKFRFSGKCDVMRVKNLRLLEVARLFARFDHVARCIENANYSVMRVQGCCPGFFSDCSDTRFKIETERLINGYCSFRAEGAVRLRPSCPPTYGNLIKTYGWALRG